MSDGHALVQAALELKPDVIIADIAMPVLNGLDAAQRVKERFTAVKLIFLTMIHDPEVAVSRAEKNHTSGAVRWGRQPGYVVFGGQKVAIPRPRVRTRKGEDVALGTYVRRQHDGRRQRAVREGILAGLTTRNYRRAVQSVLEG